MKKIPVYAWYFPGWGENEPIDIQSHGQGVYEWRALQAAQPRFEGHRIYHPLWGYEAEDNPVAMGKKIDTAMAYGVDGFLWDFYWSETGGYRMSSLKAFDKAMASRDHFRMAVMWCCEDMYEKPSGYNMPSRLQQSRRVSPEAFWAGTECLIHQYMCKPYYMTVHHKGEDKLLFIMYDLPKFVEWNGGVHGTKLLLDDFKKRTFNATGKKLYLATNARHLKAVVDGNTEEATAYFRFLGVDGCTQYGWPAVSESHEKWPVWEYSDYVDGGIEYFEKAVQSVNLPMNITVVQGWDPSPRSVPGNAYDDVGYPYTWITDHKTPQEFTRALKAAKNFFRSGRYTGDFISISCWNEWTEGNFLEPSVEDGYAYLEAVRNIFGTRENPAE